MKIQAYLDQLATIALGAGLGYFLLSRLPAEAYLIAWGLVLAGAIARVVVLPSLQRQARRGVS